MSEPSLCLRCQKPMGTTKRRWCALCKKFFHSACYSKHRLTHRDDPRKNWNFRTFTSR